MIKDRPRTRGRWPANVRLRLFRRRGEHVSDHYSHTTVEEQRMSFNSTIEWTEASWNPVRGCTKISPGCAHCYAATFAERFRGVPGHPYEQGFDLRLVPEKLGDPVEWRKPRLVFVNSMSDLFHKEIPRNSSLGYLTRWNARAGTHFKC